MTFSVIGLDASDPSKKITIGKKDRFEQLYIIGSTRQGKSTLIENLVLEDIKNDIGVCLIDPHGDLVNNIISRMTKRLDQVVYIDLADKTYVAPFNLFHCENITDDEAVENVVSAFLHILQSSFGISPDQHARMNQYFRHIATLLVYNQNHSMLDILQLLTNDDFMLQLVANVPDHWEKVFWKDFYAKYSKGMRRMEDISMISNKIEEFISPVMRPWFGDTKKTIHFRKLMDQGKIVLIKSNPQWEAITKIVGNVVIAQLLDAAYSRRNIPLGNRKQMNVYVDEYAKFASEDFSKLFSEAAKYGLSMSITQQVLEQVDLTIKAVCSQAKNVAVFSVSPQNGKELASVFDCSPQPGVPRYEPLKTPVREPIQYMVDPKHGVYLQDNTSRFIEQYGRLLVDNATEEKDIQRDSRREWQKYQHDLTIERLREEYNRSLSVNSHINPSVGFVASPSIQVSGDWRNLLKGLNDLFFAAMLCGELGKSLDTIAISPWLLGTFLQMFREDKGYLSLQSSYESVAEKNGVQIVDADKGVKQLQLGLNSLSSYKQDELIALRRKKDAVEKAWYESKHRNYYGSELNDWWEKAHFVTIFDEQWDIFIREGCKVFPDEVELFEKLVERKPNGDFVNSYLSKVDYIVLEVVKELRSVGNSGVKLINRLQFFGKKDVGDWNVIIELQRGIIFERARKILMNEWGLFPQDVSYIVPASLRNWGQFGDKLQAISRRTIHYPNWMEYVRVERSNEFSSLLEAVKVLEEEIDAYKRKREQDITTQIKLFTDLEKRKGDYNNSVSTLERQLRLIMSEFATAPIKAPCGVEKEVPTEIPTPEVEARIANQLKQLPKYTARVKLVSGEYTITTIKPEGQIGNTALQKRIVEIQEQNRKAGYLRLRAEVKEEIRKRYEPQQPVPNVGAINTPTPQQQQKVVTPPIPAKRKAAIGKICPKCQANNPATSLYCSQDGTKL